MLSRLNDVRQYTHKFLFCRIGLCFNSCKITGGSR